MGDEIKGTQATQSVRYIINKAKTRTSKFLMFAPNLIVNVLMVVALMFISMISQENEFSWKAVFSWYFLFITIALVLIYLITHWVTFDSRMKRLATYEENVEFLENNENEIKKTTNTIEWSNYRTIFVKERNEKQKIEAWKIYIQNSITKLTLKANKRNKKSVDLENEVITTFQRENLPQERIIELESDIKTRQDKNRYITRKRALEEMLTEKWIAEHINKINIDYNDIDVNFIETGDIMKGQSRDRIKKSGKYAKDNLPNRMLMTVLTTFISVFAVDLILNWNMAGWVNFVLRLMVLIVNVVMGLNYGNEFFVDTDIHNSKRRVLITDEFKVWCSAKGIVK